MLLLVTLSVITNVALSMPPYGVDCAYGDDIQLTWFPEMGIPVNTKDTNTQYQYLYTPCNLSFYSSSSNQRYAMKRYNLLTNVEQYLIPKLDQVYPKQDLSQNITTWQFQYSYTNYSCPNSAQIVDVYWQCNKTLNHNPDYYRVISAGPLFECFDSVFIQSIWACSSHYWPDVVINYTYTSNGQTIDLYDYQIGKVSDYTWNPGFNRFYENSDNWASLVYNNIGVNELVYATWNAFDGFVDYYYDPAVNVWNFTVIGYDEPDTGCNVLYTNILFGCNCNEEAGTYVNWYQQFCNLVINASNHDLCINYINQCYPPENNTDCVYYYRDEPNEPYDKLDLSPLTNDHIGAVEDGGSFAFIYTPCNNNFLCDDTSNSSVLSMAGRRSINSNECIEPLALFDGTAGFNVSHTMGTTTWVIEYYNGKCPSNPDVALRFRTTWKYGDAEWFVDSVDFDQDACIYDVTISTQYTIS